MIIAFATYRACQKCKKSKTAGLRCFRVATVGIFAAPTYGAYSAWRLRRLVPSPLVVIDAWHLWALALGACGAQRHCLFGLASRGLQGPKSVYSDRPQRDSIVVYHAWARISLPTTSGEVSRQLWTKYDVLTLRRR